MKKDLGIKFYEKLISLKEAEKCPLCSFPFGLRSTFGEGKKKQVFFKCFPCNKIFFQKGSEFIEVDKNFDFKFFLGGS